MMIHGIDHAYLEQRAKEAMETVRLEDIDGLGSLGEHYRQNKHLSDRRHVGNFLAQL